MEETTSIQIALPNELNYALDIHLAALRRDGTKCTKAELIIKLMRIGLIKESRELLKEERAEK